MIIPERFKQYGQTIEVGWDDRMAHCRGSKGECYAEDNKILLQRPSEATPYPKSNVEQSFCHELVHQILKGMNERGLFENEKFVDVFGSLLHQFLITGEGELK